ncbi:MAG: DUF732 domain-containing protein [Blastococcus sp.]|nr:DUF732 domain-containing protein [Blastococcus sp.]
MLATPIWLAACGTSGIDTSGFATAEADYLDRLAASALVDETTDQATLGRAVRAGHLVCESEATGRSGASIVEPGVEVGGYTRAQAAAIVAAAEDELC